MRTTLKIALLHNISQRRELIESEVRVFNLLQEKHPDLSIEECLYEETNYIEDIRKTVFGYEEEKFYSTEGQKKFYEYEKNNSKKWTDEDISEHSELVELNSEEFEKIFEEQFEKEIEENKDNLSNAIESFLSLPPEFRDMFIESVNRGYKLYDSGELKFISSEDNEEVETQPTSEDKFTQMMKEMEERMLLTVQQGMNNMTEKFVQEHSKPSPIRYTKKEIEKIKKDEERLRKIKLIEKKPLWNLSDVATLYKIGKNTVKNYTKEYKNKLLCNHPDEKSHYVFEPEVVKEYMAKRGFPSVEKTKTTLEDGLKQKPTNEQIDNFDRAELQKVVEVKQTLTPKELEIKFGWSEEKQRRLRGLLHDPLPHNKVGIGTTKSIEYNSIEVDQWKENNSEKVG